MSATSITNNITMTLTGYLPLPRYWVIEFHIHRVSAPPRLRIEDPNKTRLREKVQGLRAIGMSYPDIAHNLNLSVGTVWNYAHRKS